MEDSLLPPPFSFIHFIASLLMKRKQKIKIKEQSDAIVEENKWHDTIIRSAMVDCLEVCGTLDCLEVCGTLDCLEVCGTLPVFYHRILSLSHILLVLRAMTCRLYLYIVRMLRAKTCRLYL